MPYQKTIWTETTAITPARLNNLETQYEKAIADAVTEAAQEIEFYVSPSGNDNNPGTEDAPFRTIQRAVDEVAKSIAGQATIYIANGTYSETIEIKNVLCSKIYFYGANRDNTIINGYIGIDNAQYVRFYRMTIRNGIYGVLARSLRRLELQNVTINNASLNGVDARGVEAVSINSSSINAGGKAISCAIVGNLYVSGCAISGVSGAGISISSGTVAYTGELTGNIGSVPVHSVHGSLLFKDASSITGGADVTSGGGQIFKDS